MDQTDDPYDFEASWDELKFTLGGRGRFKDLTGSRFGRLTVLERTGGNSHGSALWLCICDCGAEKVVSRRDLRNGAVKSCGCLRKEAVKKPRGRR